MCELPADRPIHGGRRSRLGRWLRDVRGATAVEFSLVVLPFVFIVFSITEVCVANAVSAALDNATNQAARQIMTGQFTLTGPNATTAFKTKICDNLNWLGSSCTTNLSVSVQTFNAFSNAAKPVVTDANGAFSDQNLAFSGSAAGSIVMVNTYLKWQLLTPYFLTGFNASTDGTTVFESTVAFRNEPYA
jgi:Flp pilus assembly protein TadG